MKDPMPPDLTIVRFHWANHFVHNKVADYPLFHQIRKEAKLRRVDDSSIDAFLEQAGKHGLTVEIIDHKQPN